MISKELYINKENCKKLFNNTSDLVLYEFTTMSNINILLAYFNGIIDEKQLAEDIIREIMRYLKEPENILSTVFIACTEEIKHISKLTDPITLGNVAVFIEGIDVAYLFNIAETKKRSIEEPGNERIVRGPKEGFIEDIHTNKSLLRKALRSNNLIFEDFNIGEDIKTTVSIAYIKNNAEKELITKVREKISSIKTQRVLSAVKIEDALDGKGRTLVPTVYNSEKPNVIASKILDGKIAIFCDGSPDVLVVPMFFIENLQLEEDYYLKKQYAMFIRFLRIIALIISIGFPGFLVALKTFHQEMIPKELLINMVINIEKVPFTPIIEALLMVAFLELIKESSVRIPTNVGQTATVVSGLVLGQTAVQAGLVGPVMVIVIGATGISEFIVPRFRPMITIYRLVMIILGGFLGLYGLTCGLIIIVIYFISIKTLDQPYMYPIAPYDKEKFKDFVFVRRPNENTSNKTNVKEKMKNWLK